MSKQDIDASFEEQPEQLESCLVHQQRWPAARWRELFETNPALQPIADSLVWGVYLADGTLRATFRRQPDGLLADAAGGLVELDEAGDLVGMVHPLELGDETLVLWRKHLGRFKIKPPFPQLDRPVARLRLSSGGYKEIGFTSRVDISCGTFLTRTGKRGWVRGPVSETGEISTYFKAFPEAGVDVYLITGNFRIGMEPTEILRLGSAYFVKSGSIEAGSHLRKKITSRYLYDHLALYLEQVPPIVYSETIADLEAIAVDHQDTEGIIKRLWHSTTKWELAPEPDPEAPFVARLHNDVWNLKEEEIQANLRFLGSSTVFYHALAMFKPDIITAYLHRLKMENEPLGHRIWELLISQTDRFDPEFLAQAKVFANVDAKRHTEEANTAEDYFLLLCDWHRQRSVPPSALLLDLAGRKLFAGRSEAVELLLEHRPDEALDLVAEGLENNSPSCSGGLCEKLVELAKRDLEGAGGRFLRAVHFEWLGSSFRQRAQELLFTDPPEAAVPLIHDLFAGWMSSRSGKDAIDAWVELAEYPCKIFDAELRPFLVGKSKRLRDAAAAHFAATEPRESFEHAVKLLGSKTTDERIGGICLLGKLGTPEAVGRLEQCLATEKSRQVRRVLAEILPKFGIAVAPEPEKKAPKVASLSEFEAALAKKPKSIKLPNAAWLDAGSLPPLVSTEGTRLAELTVTYLIQKQARGNRIEIAPELEPLIPMLDREKNAAFAHAVLDQWFASDQKANTRWALGLAGVTGDKSIIPRLTEPIEDWCQQNRGAIAQWAVKGIGLLGSDEALTTLDELANKFRTKRRYVGAAAREALVVAAGLRGISLDELDDLIVPDFGFDSMGHRPFATKKGRVIAVLQPDFKLSWLAPDTGKKTKSTPAGLTEEAAAELKEVRKFLRKAGKAQTARLERMMVVQRRWPAARWRELFEQHPLLQTFAERLVWGVYDADNTLRRTFRRYPNGLLADAKGELEELNGAGAGVGIVHPLDLDENAVNDWLRHLHQFKVKPPFKQLDRPCHAPDPSHGNRRQITLAAGTTLKATTLRSRCEKRGWTPAPTEDSAWIPGFFKQYADCGIEVYLDVDDLHAYSTYEDDVKIDKALFARANPDKRHAHLYDRPNDDDPRVLRFDQVPPIVYSETIGDLMAIIS